MHIWKKRKILKKINNVINYIIKVYNNDFDVDPQDLDANEIINRQRNKNIILNHFSEIIRRVLLEE